MYWCMYLLVNVQFKLCGTQVGGYKLLFIYAFISVRLDYCNSLYVGISQVLLNRLQLVFNRYS